MRHLRYSLFLLVFLIPTLVSAELAPGSAGYDSNFMKGYNFPAWWGDAYLKTSTEASLTNMVNDGGATWVAIGPFWYQNNAAATTIYQGSRTASDASVEHIIRLAHEKGLKIMLKPLVDAEGGEWRGTFKPKDVDAWFASYAAMAVHYAAMAERLNVEAYLIGAEYVTLSGTTYAEKWRDVVKAVREKYKGQIGYGANWDDQRGTPEFELVTWWDAVDFIGIHAYFPLTKKNDATLNDMMQGIVPWVKRVEVVQAKYKKRVVFTEVGYKSCDGGTRIPWWCNPKAKTDLQEQSDGSEAILKAFQGKLWFAGMFWWLWTIEPDGYSTSYSASKEHDLNKKPALAVIRKYWNTSSTTQIVIPDKDLGSKISTTPNKSADAFYGKPRLTAKEEKKWEQKMWKGVGSAFRWKKPKIRPGLWTIALRAYIYGGYPIDKIRYAFTHDGAGIDSVKPWGQK